jgi:FkbM family methyltransferase
MDAIAFRIAKSLSRVPRAGGLVASSAANLFPALRCYPVQTRYGRIYCDLRESVCLALLSHGEYVRWRADEEAIGRIPLNSNSTVLDVGANIGVTVRLFANRAGHVHAFEPSTRAMALLKANTADLNNVTLHQYALSNESGAVRFEEKGKLDLSSISDTGIEVPAKTIDCLALPADFIKIDVEGYEHLVLQGARQTLRERAPIVMFEALSETARQYCENIISDANPSYRFESIGEKMNHIAWPTVTES